MLSKTPLRQVLSAQQVELRETVDHLFPRGAEKQLIKLIASSVAKVVMGIRRCGKSSLCLKAIEGRDVAYVNFDDERLMGMQASDLNPIFEVLLELVPRASVLFFDEIQNVEGWELFVNRLLRNRRNLLITGSNGKLLGGELATSLTGRHLSFTLFPLSFREFLTWKYPDMKIPPQEGSSADLAKVAAAFEEFFRTGGFPEIIQHRILGQGEIGGPYLRELYDKIISRDIVQRHHLRSAKSIKELASYLIQNSGQYLSFDRLQKAFGVTSVSATQRYVQYLEECYLIFELRGYSYKLKERSTSQRKIYACDTGMMNALWAKATEDLGAKLETIVFLELLKAGHEVYYLREEKRDVDFCVVLGRKIKTLIQVCYDMSDPATRDREFNALEFFAGRYKVDELLIVTRDHRERIERKNCIIECVPVYKFCLRL